MSFNQNYYCPITQQLMEDPVMDSEGNTFERSAIEEWLRIRRESPITRSPMTVENLVPNRALKAAIDDERANLPSSRPDGAAPLDINAVDTVNLPSVADLQMEVLSVPANEIVHTESEENSIVVANIIPRADSSRVPTDIVVCIDTSGSMGMEAAANGVESSGLDMLDIVKHAVKTIIKVLGPEDRLGIVEYSNSAKRRFELSAMNESGRERAMEALEMLESDGMTNLWDGLKNSLDMLYDRNENTIFQNVPSTMRNAAIYLLTDGVPNVSPPRGYVPSMQRMKDKNGGKYPAVINTFGFGYNLKSDLLLELAQEGQGTYAFIPDSGFVGTVFVNALGNTLTTIANECTVSISAESADAAIKPYLESELISQPSEDSAIFIGKTIQIGQPSGTVFSINRSELPLVLAEVKYITSRNQESRTMSLVGPTQRVDEVDTQEVAAEYFRLSLITTVCVCLKLGMENEYANAGAIIDRKVELINNWLERTTECEPKHVPGETKISTAARAKVIGLKDDLDGQIREACSKSEYFEKWGVHFLRSIMRAHQLKQCNNFKDPGVQHYGNTVFKAVRDDADDVFSEMPPPVKRVPLYAMAAHGTRNYASAPPPTISMRSYNSSAAGCFHGDSLVSLANGTCKPAGKVVPGDTLSAGGRVKCVVKTCVNGKIALIRLPESSLLITPYHPVRFNGNWEFPINVGEWIEVDCEAVYSFLVESGCVAGKYASCALVNGVPTAMLAHGVENVQCLSHPFFGTDAVVAALEGCHGFDSGFVVFNQDGYFTRDPVTNQVCGIHTAMALQT